MPIKHAALKQLRKDRKRRARNQASLSELKTLTRRLLELLKSRQLPEAGQLMRVVAKKYDHAASRRVIHVNTARRHKSRLMRQLNKAAA